MKRNCFEIDWRETTILKIANFVSNNLVEDEKEKIGYG